MGVPLCIQLGEVPDPFAVPLPGGIEVEDVDVERMLQSALTPLVPLFNIIDTIVAIFNCLKAVPDTLGPPPDPTALTACLPELAEKLDKLLNLLPQVSLPRLIHRILLLVIEVLGRVRARLVQLQRQLERVAFVTDRARELEDAGLAAIVACAEGNVAQEARNLGKNLASIGRLLGMVNLFMGLIGGPAVPDLSSIAGQPIDLVLEPLDALLTVLHAVRNALPLP